MKKVTLTETEAQKFGFETLTVVNDNDIRQMREASTIHMNQVLSTESATKNFLAQYPVQNTLATKKRDLVMVFINGKIVIK
jgi:hypothetical protein